MPSAIRRDHDLADKGLVTVLMERQGATEADMLAFLLKTFPDNDAFACVAGNVPLPSFGGLPHAALIGVDGKLVWDGSPLGEGQKLEACIAEEVAKVKKGWGDSADARKIRAQLYGKGDLAGARKSIEALPEGAERTALQAELERRYATSKATIGYLQQDGRWPAAQDAAKDLARHVEGCEDWKAEVAQLTASFDTDTGKAELAAGKKLQRAEKQLHDKKFDQAVKALQGVVKGAEGTATAGRAQRLLKAADNKH